MISMDRVLGIADDESDFGLCSSIFATLIAIGIDNCLQEGEEKNGQGQI